MSKWKKYKLSDIGEIKTGKTPPSKCKEAFSSYGIPFVTPVDMKGQKWIYKTERYITKNGLETVKNYLVPQNSIAVSCIGSDMGKTVLLKKGSITNQQINTVIVNDKHNYEYVYYVLSLMQDYFKSISGGSATPILNKSDFSKVEIKLPSLDIQNRLIEYIRYFDEKIELNTQTNQTLESIAQAIFKSWFVDFDPIYAKINAIENGEDPTLAAMQTISCKNYEELDRLQTENPQEYRELEKLANAFPCEIGEGGVPVGWGIMKIEDVIQKITVGKKYSSKTVEKIGKVPVLDQGKSGLIGYHNNEAGVKANIENPVIVFANHTCYMRLISYDFSAIQNVFAFKGKQTNIYWTYLATLGKQSFVEYKGHFPDFLIKEIIVPNVELTELFGKYVKTIFSKIAKNEEENKNLEKIRDLLLPRLLSGELQNE